MQLKQLQDEVKYQVARGSGPGGQNVNRTESAVTLRWSVDQTMAFNIDQRMKLLERLNSKLTNDFELIIKCQVHRDQLSNKEDAFKNFISTLELALFDHKPRRKTKPKKSSVRKRLNEKKHHGEIKKLRSKKDWS